MRKLTYLFIINLFCFATAPVTLKAAPSGADLYSFCVGLAASGIPVIGQVTLIDYLIWCNASRSTRDQQRVIPAATGIVAGTTAWFGLVQFLKAKLPDSSCEPYIYASLPGPVALGILYLTASLKKRRKYRAYNS